MPQKPDRSDQVQQLDAFMFGFVDLPLGLSGHLSPGAPVDDGHLLCSEAERRSGGVESGIPAANDHHFSAQPHLLAEIHVPQKVHGLHDALQILSGDV